MEDLIKLIGELDSKNLLSSKAYDKLMTFAENQQSSKRYFLFECVNADKQKLNKLIIANDKESAIADIETSYPYIERWYTIEELNVC